MALSFEDVQQVWARKKFDQRGLKYEKDDVFTIDSTIIYGGYCETCSYESAGYEIRNSRTRQVVEVEMYFSELMQELEELSQEEAE
jgi:hypothetical protein